MSEFMNAFSTPRAHAVVTLYGASRDIYGFTAFPVDVAPARACICIFVCPPKGATGFAPSYWTPLYIRASAAPADGDADPRSIAEQARQMGATHVLVHFCDRGEEARRDIVEDLVAALRPPLNAEGHRKAA
jgi:hypothetical protein